MQTNMIKKIKQTLAMIQSKTVVAIKKTKMHIAFQKNIVGSRLNFVASTKFATLTFVHFLDGMWFCIIAVSLKI